MAHNTITIDPALLLLAVTPAREEDTQVNIHRPVDREGVRVGVGDGAEQNVPGPRTVGGGAMQVEGE